MSLRSTLTILVGFGSSFVAGLYGFEFNTIEYWGIFGVSIGSFILGGVK